MKTLKLNESQFKHLNNLIAKASAAKKEYDHEQEKFTSYVLATMAAAGLEKIESVQVTAEGLVYDEVEEAKIVE